MAACFCTNCGNKMEYSFSPPNFCGKCGTKLNASVSTASVAKAPKARQIEREDEDFDDEEEGGDDYSNSKELPHITSFAYEFESDTGNRQYKLGQLFGENVPVERRKRAVSLDDFKRDGKKG